MFFLSCYGYLGETLELHKGSQAFFQVSRGNSGLRSRHCKGIWSHLALSGNLVIFLELWQEAWVSSRVSMRTSGNLLITTVESDLLSNCMGNFGIPLKSLQGNKVSSRVEVGNSVFLSSCHRDLRGPIEFQWGSGLISCRGTELCFLLEL